MTTVTRFTLLLAASGVVACTSLHAPHQVTTAQATHSYIVAGSGSPTVIFEAGLGDGKKSWQPVFDRVAQITQVFAYDRAGYGASRSTHQDRNGRTVIEELRATLQALQLRPPFVLVGHSLGGTYKVSHRRFFRLRRKPQRLDVPIHLRTTPLVPFASLTSQPGSATRPSGSMELFAREYPDEVAGVVLVDSRHAEFSRRCKQAAARSCEPPVLLAALLPQAAKRELAASEQTSLALSGGGEFPNVPVAVLSSGKRGLEGARFRDVWLQTQAELAALSVDSTHAVCDRCGHYIHRDNPGLVVTAIQSVIKRANDRGRIEGKRPADRRQIGS